MRVSAMPAGLVICGSPLAMTETRPASPPLFASRQPSATGCERGPLRHRAAARDIHRIPSRFERHAALRVLHDRLLNRATDTSLVQHFDRFQQTNIIPWVRGEHGKFL